jgi:uncharacterized membrane protein YdjX (TVP38/TMEM64 family)
MLDHTVRTRLRWLLALAVALLALGLGWQVASQGSVWTPLALIDAWRGAAQQLGWPAVLGSFVLACTLAVPLSVLTLLAVLAFGPLWGGVLALGGASVSALISHALGRGLGQAALSQWAGPRLTAWNEAASRRGLVAVVLVRWVPAAPFAVVNLLLGSTHIAWGALVLGNLIGMLPMVLVVAWAAPALLAQMQTSSQGGWSVLLGLVGVLALVAAVAAAPWALRRWVRRA